MATLNKNQQQYKDLYEELQQGLNKLTDNQIMEILKAMKSNRDMLLDEIAKVILKYNVFDNSLDLNLAQKRMLINMFNDLIDNTLSKELKEERKELGTMLVAGANEKELTLNFLNEVGGVNTDIRKVDKGIKEKIINAKVNGKGWTKRYGDNKNAIADRLKKDIKDLLNGDTDINTIRDNIIKTYNINADATKRLISNEVNRVQESICEEWQKNNSVEYVIYSATLEHNTCSECGKYDGKVYEIDKKPVEIPQHPNCRCTYIGIPNKNWRPKTRLDNSTKKNIVWQSYQEWKNSLE